MEHARAEARDDTARFLRELRQLRNGAGLGQAELAARVHYPHDSIRAAEAGPSLPELPVLAAYVRGCGGTTEEWEERWRTLTRSSALSTLPTRAAGCSSAASAGARIGAVAPAADGPDPATIMAALDRVAEAMSAATAAPAQEDGPPRTAVPWQSAQPVTEIAPAEPAVLTTTSIRDKATASPAGAGITTADGAAPAGQPSAVGRLGSRLPLPPRTLVAALVAVALCVLVAVLAIFA